MRRHHSYYIAPSAVVPLFLDINPGAVLCLSFFKKRAGYNGPCINVKNLTTGLYMDIGFSGNYLDIATLTTFLNGAVGAIVIFYDQSLFTNHAFMNVLINQPTINLIDAEINNKSSITLGGNDYLTFPYLFPSAQSTCSIFVVNKSTGLSPIISDTNGASYSVVADWYNAILIQGINPGYDQYSPNAQANFGYLSCLISGDSNNKVYKNGIQISPNTVGNRLLNFNSLGYWAAANFYMNGRVSELIVYPTTVSNDTRLMFESEARSNFGLL